MSAQVKRLVTLEEMRKAIVPSRDEIRSDLVPRLGVVHRKQTRQVFATEGAAGGKRWRPLTPKYRRWKQKRKPGRKILVFSGEMRKSFTAPSHPEYIQRYRRGTIELGSRHWKAQFHEREAHEDPRRPLRRTDLQFEEITREVGRYMRPRFDRYMRVLRQVARSRK